MSDLTVSVLRQGRQARERVEDLLTGMTITDEIGLRGDGANLTLVGDWSDAARVIYTIEEDSERTRNISSSLAVLTASVTDSADGGTITRLKAGRRLRSVDADYTAQIRAALTDAVVRALSPRMNAWSGRFSDADGVDITFADALAQLLDGAESLSEYISTLADYRIGVEIDAILPTPTTAAGVTLYDMDIPANLTVVALDPDDAMSWSRDYDRYANPLGAWANARASYLVGTGGQFTSVGSGQAEPERLGEFQYEPLALARLDAFRSQRNGESLTGTLAIQTFDIRLRPRTGVSVIGYTPATLWRWLVDGVTLDAGGDGGFTTTLRMRATQRANAG